MKLQHVDAEIIGAGIFGLSAAWALAKRGMSVRVREAGRVGSGASGGLVGALAPHIPEKWNAKKAFQLSALLGLKAFWDEAEELSGQPSGYARIGRVMPLREERHRDQALVRAQEAPLLWQGKAMWQVIEHCAHVADAPFGFVHETLSSKLHPRLALAALSKALEQRGVEIVLGQKVGRDDLNATHHIIAAGHQSQFLSPHIPGEFWYANKGQSALLDVQLPLNMPMVFEGGIYIVPHGAHGVAVGSTVEYEYDDPTGTDGQLDEVLARAASLVPALKDAPVADRWAGVRPRARLPDPVIGQMPDGAWLVAGGFKTGLAYGPAMGETLAAMLQGDTPEVPPSFHLTHHLSRCKAGGFV